MGIWDTNIYLILLGALGSVIAMIIAAFFTTLNPYKAAKSYFVKRKILKRIRNDYLTQFDNKREGIFRKSRYYYRDKEKYSESSFGAPFDMLQNPEVSFFEFKGFLIPPLDNGRTVDSCDGENAFSSDISREWKAYFDAIGKKSQIKREELGGKVVSKRIVFFEKFFVDYFLSDPIGAIESSGVKFVDEKIIFPEQAPAFGKLAQQAVSSAYQLMSIYRFNRSYEDDVETIYLDKSNTQSHQYYDFGLYNFGGAKLVYMPIFIKSPSKSMVGDRVYLNESREHEASIHEFEKDFKDVWNLCQTEITKGKRILGDIDDVSQIRDRLFVYKSEIFNKIYYEPLLYEFKNRLGWKPTE